MSTVISPITDAALRASEAIRTICHIAPGAFTYPSDAYSTIAELAQLGHRLQQALEQIAGYIDAEHDAGRVVCDWGTYSGHTDEAVDLAGDALRRAAAWASEMGQTLEVARAATAGLAAVEPVEAEA